MTALLTMPGSYAIDCLTAQNNIPLYGVDLSRLDLPAYRCPYGFPVIESGQRLIVVSGWLSALRQQGVDVVERVLAPLRERFSAIIGFDQADPFQLDFPDEEMDLMDLVLKVNGVYRDKSLYNYVVGAPTPDGRWTEKIEPREISYSRFNLEKLSLSIPCFLGVNPEMRAHARRIAGRSPAGRVTRSLADRVLNSVSRPASVNRPPKNTVHFFASLTHVQRLNAARMLRSSALPWKGGITNVPSFVTGLRGIGMASLTTAERQELANRISTEGLMAPRMNRLRYQLRMADCKAVLSITGYGELCFRMAEAWANRRVLVCQDLSHVQTLFPFEAGRNVVYCRPDLSDLVEILEDIECNFRSYADIAEQGYRDWTRWSNNLDAIMKDGFAPLYEHAGAATLAKEARSAVALNI